MSIPRGSRLFLGRRGGHYRKRATQSLSLGKAARLARPERGSNLPEGAAGSGVQLVDGVFLVDPAVRKALESSLDEQCRVVTQGFVPVERGQGRVPFRIGANGARKDARTERKTGARCVARIHELGGRKAQRQLGRESGNAAQIVRDLTGAGRRTQDEHRRNPIPTPLLNGEARSARAFGNRVTSITDTPDARDAKQTSTGQLGVDRRLLVAAALAQHEGALQWPDPGLRRLDEQHWDGVLLGKTRRDVRGLAIEACDQDRCTLGGQTAQRVSQAGAVPSVVLADQLHRSSSRSFVGRTQAACEPCCETRRAA